MRLLVALFALSLLALSFACGGDDPAPAPAPVRLLEFATEPGNGTGGSALSPQPVIKVTNSAGATVTSSSAVVTLTITAGTGTVGAQLIGTATVTAVAGVATFTDVGVDLIGLSYTLEATAANKTTATSAAFKVGAGPPTQLEFVAPIADVQVATTAPLIRVRLLDAGGNLSTTASSLVTIGFAGNKGSNLYHAYGNPARVASAAELYDPASGQTIQLAAPSQAGGLVYESATNLILGADWSASFTEGNWVEIDPATGNETILSSLKVVGGEQGLAFDAAGTIVGVGSFGGVSDQTLYNYNRTSGVAKDVGTVTVSGDTIGTFHGLARDPFTGTMYTVMTLGGTSGGGARMLATLDTATRVATVIGQMTHDNIAGITYLGNGRLYAVLCGANGQIGTVAPGTIYTVDTATAKMTLVTALSGSGVGDHAIVGVPGQLRGSLTESPISGVVTFKVSFTAAANGYTLLASSPGLASAFSTAFDVTP